MRTRGILVAAMLALTACGSRATVMTATPTTAQAALDNARAGDTIQLAAGDYSPLVLKNKDWTPSVTVDATSARITSVTLYSVSELSWHGGNFDGRDTERVGFKVNAGSRLVVDGTTMRHYLRVGIGVGGASDLQLTNNIFTDMGSDGIDIALSRRITIDHTDCHDFYPTDGAHPDCIQLWSRPTAPPTADVTITNTRAVGSMQGISLFNHVRDGVDDGGFDRITITNNFVRLLQYNGITMSDCRECIARDNRVETLPNPKIRTWLRTTGKGNVELCGNTIIAFPAMPGQQACPRSRNGGADDCSVGAPAVACRPDGW